MSKSDTTLPPVPGPGPSEPLKPSDDWPQTTVRRVKIGTMTCVNCSGRGEVWPGQLCSVCNGNTTVPMWKDVKSDE